MSSALCQLVSKEFPGTWQQPIVCTPPCIWPPQQPWTRVHVHLSVLAGSTVATGLKVPPGQGQPGSCSAHRKSLLSNSTHAMLPVVMVWKHSFHSFTNGAALIWHLLLYCRQGWEQSESSKALAGERYREKTIGEQDTGTAGWGADSFKSGNRKHGKS